jgi:hypothetical protein
MIDPANAASPLSSAEQLRYARHLSLPEIGLDGQRRLRQASVLVIGAGGLGGGGGGGPPNPGFAVSRGGRGGPTGDH